VEPSVAIGSTVGAVAFAVAAEYTITERFTMIEQVKIVELSISVEVVSVREGLTPSLTGAWAMSLLCPRLAKVGVQ
jgi:hypothetical protein